MEVGGRESGEVDAGEIEEGVAVVGGEVVFGLEEIVSTGLGGGDQNCGSLGRASYLVVAGVGAVEGGVDFGLDRVECVEDGLCFVEVFAGTIHVLEAELHF